MKKNQERKQMHYKRSSNLIFISTSDENYDGSIKEDIE